MKKFVFVLFQMLAMLFQGIILFALVIIGIDLFNRHIEDKKSSEGEK